MVKRKTNVFGVEERAKEEKWLNETFSPLADEIHALDMYLIGLSTSMDKDQYEYVKTEIIKLSGKLDMIATALSHNPHLPKTIKRKSDKGDKKRLSPEGRNGNFDPIRDKEIVDKLKKVKRIKVGYAGLESETEW